MTEVDGGGPPGAALAGEGYASVDAMAEAFVGRRREMSILEGLLEAAGSGRGAMVFLVGGAGIGKTRLAEELGRVAEARGIPVLWGRCWEGEGAPAYWPWLQVIRLFSPSGESATLSRSPRPQASPEERFRVSDDLAALIRAEARSRPLVVVIDDLQWADQASLLVLQLLAREVSDIPLLLVATYRDIDFSRRREATETLGWLARHGRRVLLGGLDRTEVGRMIELDAGDVAPPELVAAVHEETDGNPFFVHEVVRSLLDEGGLHRGPDGAEPELVVPDTIRDVIAARLGRLSPAAAELLTVASAAGQECEERVIAEIADVTPEGLSRALGELIAEGYLRRLSDPPARYRFAHGLIRTAVHDAIPAQRRAALHGEIGSAIEGAGTPLAEPLPAQLSYHFGEAAAGSAEAAARAVDYAVQAAEHALSQLAYEQAAVHWQRALRAHEAWFDDEERRCALLLSLADALSMAGQTPRARVVFRRAVESARALQNHTLLARAALGFAGRGLGDQFQVDQAVVALLEEAVGKVAPADGELKAQLLARLSRALYFSRADGAQERRISLSLQAMAMAQEIGSPAAEIAAVGSRYWAATPSPDARFRLGLTSRLVCLAEGLGDGQTSLQSRQLRIDEQLLLGMRFEADAEQPILAELAAQLRHPLYAHVAALYPAMRALLEGRFQDGRRLAGEARATGERWAVAMAAQAFGVQMQWLDAQVGGLSSEARLARARDWAERYPFLANQAALAIAKHEAGRKDEAGAFFDALAARDFVDVPRDHYWLPTMAVMAMACTTVGRPHRAEQLYALLLGYAGQHIFVRPFLLYHGSVDHHLGRLAMTARRPEVAAGHAERAAQISAALGSPPHEVLARVEWARALLADPAGADHEAAGHHLEYALVEAERLGMVPLIGLIRRLREQGDPVAPPRGAVPAAERAGVHAAAGEPRPAELNVFRREGAYWSVLYEGEVIRVKDAKGVRYLAHLLARPGREIHSADLLALAATDRAGDWPPSAQHHDHQDELHLELSDAGEVIDDQARAQYRERLVELREDLDEAERFNDGERATELRIELDFLTDQLAATMGLGRRPRRFSDAAERARKAVTNRVRTSLGVIAGDHPALGAHLSSSIATGTFCSYRPREPTAWKL